MSTTIKDECMVSPSVLLLDKAPPHVARNMQSSGSAVLVKNGNLTDEARRLGYKTIDEVLSNKAPNAAT